MTENKFLKFFVSKLLQSFLDKIICCKKMGLCFRKHTISFPKEKYCWTWQHRIINTNEKVAFCCGGIQISLYFLERKVWKVVLKFWLKSISKINTKPTCFSMIYVSPYIWGSFVFSKHIYFWLGNSSCRIWIHLQLDSPRHLSLQTRTISSVFAISQLRNGGSSKRVTENRSLI